MRKNRGKFEGTDYIKNVSFSSAVLWMTKELSLPLDIIAEARIKGTQRFCFVDKKKGETWVFKPEDVFNGTRKKVGQETQYYFPISKAEIKKHGSLSGQIKYGKE